MVAAERERKPAVAVNDLPVDHSHDIFSIPNVVTVLRLALIPVFFWFLVFEPPVVGARNDVAFGFFVASAGTDWLDGWLARRTGQVTALGKIIDPLVDRLLIAGALLGLYLVGRVSLLLLIVLVGRDVYLLYGAWILERRSVRIPVTMLGKVTTAVLMAAFASLIWDYPLVPLPVLGRVDTGTLHLVFGGTQPLGSYLVLAGLVLSLTAAARYTVIARRAYQAAAPGPDAAAPDGSGAGS